MSDALDALIAAMRSPGPVDDDPRDHDAAWETRRDPDAEMDAREDAYEASLDRHEGTR